MAAGARRPILVLAAALAFASPLAAQTAQRDGIAELIAKAPATKVAETTARRPAGSARSGTCSRHAGPANGSTRARSEGPARRRAGL